MDKTKINISAIEDYLITVVKDNVSKNVFAGGLPSAPQSTWTDFVMVDVSSTIEDLNAYGSGVVTIHLFPAKNLSNGSKNRVVLRDLDTKLMNAIKSTKDDNYYIEYIGATSATHTTLKLHYNIVYINLTII